MLDHIAKSVPGTFVDFAERETRLVIVINRPRNIMKIAVLLTLLISPLVAEVYELRTYIPNEGKMEALLSRFRDHTTTIFETHGMKNVGYWVTNEDEPKLVYLITHENEEAAKKNWKAFSADPKWKKAKDASEVDGGLVKKVISQYLTPTDFSKLK